MTKLKDEQTTPNEKEQMVSLISYMLKLNYKAFRIIQGQSYVIPYVGKYHIKHNSDNFLVVPHVAWGTASKLIATTADYFQMEKTELFLSSSRKNFQIEKLGRLENIQNNWVALPQKKMTAASSQTFARFKQWSWLPKKYVL